MPVYLRKFYVDRLVEIRGKESEKQYVEPRSKDEAEEQKKRNQRKK